MGNIYIALGANLSNPKETFVSALDRLEHNGAEIIQSSGVWQSPSWPPGRGHPDYLNAVVRLGFSGSSQQLLSLLMKIEGQLGRERSERNAPRTLDLDIVDFQGRVLQSEVLTLPHPRMYNRGFVLFPLHQIAEDWRDPVTGHSIMYFIERLPLADVSVMKYMGTIR